jgi:hypothetical protein
MNVDLTCPHCGSEIALGNTALARLRVCPNCSRKLVRRGISRGAALGFTSVQLDDSSPGPDEDDTSQMVEGPGEANEVPADFEILDAKIVRKVPGLIRVYGLFYMVGGAYGLLLSLKLRSGMLFVSCLCFIVFGWALRDGARWVIWLILVAAIFTSIRLIGSFVTDDSATAMRSAFRLAVIQLPILIAAFTHWSELE